jgi:hypothetical protein
MVVLRELLALVVPAERVLQVMEARAVLAAPVEMVVLVVFSRLTLMVLEPSRQTMPYKVSAVAELMVVPAVLAGPGPPPAVREAQVAPAVKVAMPRS